MRPILVAIFLSSSACDFEPVSPVLEVARVELPDDAPFHKVDVECFPRTMTILTEAERALATGDASRANLLARGAEVPARDEERRCAPDVDERIRMRRLSVRHSALRMSNAADIDVLRDLGNEAFEAHHCKEDLAPRCAEQLAWFSSRFPNFVGGDRVAIRSMDRLPITPQPGGRLTVEYMETVENRLALLEGDVFAMTLDPSARTETNADVELRVDGADVIEGPERKRGAHVALRVPMSDAPSRGPVVLLVRKSDFRRDGPTTWRAPARIAFASR